MLIPEVSLKKAQNWKTVKRAKPKKAIISKSILQLDGTEKEHDFEVLYYFTPEPDIDIVKISWFVKRGNKEVKTVIKVNKTYFEQELLKLHCYD